jgi:hypothetical protein
MHCMIGKISGGAFFSFAKKTSEYSEIYREQLTSEHFLPFPITAGHLHYRVYLGISANFYDSVRTAPTVHTLYICTHKQLKYVLGAHESLKSKLGGIFRHHTFLFTYLPIYFL